VGLELVGEDGGDDDFFWLGQSSFCLAFGGSSSFLINEVISNPLNGFCSVVLVGDINLLSDSWTGLLAGLLMSEMIRQNE
jgi:hypothetical protein